MESTFDSLNAARELERSGMDRPQAEAVATAIRAGQGNVATREDVLALRAEMSAMRWMMGIQMDKGKPITFPNWVLPNV